MVLVLVVVFYLVAPLMIWAVSGAFADPRFEPVSLEFLPPSMRRYFESGGRQLSELGFESRGYLAMSGSAALSGVVALWARPDVGDTAIIVRAKGPFQRTSVLEFQTEFSEGTRIATNNWSNLTVLARVPKDHKLSLPGIDARRLYLVHRARVGKHMPPDADRIPETGGEAETVRKDMIRSYEEQVAAGWMRRTRHAGSYRPTLLGAFLMTWGLMWPISWCRRGMRRMRVRRELDELALGAFPLLPVARPSASST